MFHMLGPTIVAKRLQRQGRESDQASVTRMIT